MGGGRALLSELSVAAPARGGLLISGPSGAGKTTLLRAVAGLWRHGGSGVVRRETGLGRILFLPQRPYMTLGSLREQVVYPFGAALGVDDAELHKILDRVGLCHVLESVGGDLEAARRWDEALSLGEQQRVAVARILAQRPAYAVLDEATSANDAAREVVMYECVRATCEAFVSVSHRESVQRFHCKRLRLFGELEGGRWLVEDI